MTTRPLSYGAVVAPAVQGDFGVNGATTTGLTFGIKTGVFIASNNTATTVAAGTVGLTDNLVNYVTVNAGGFSVGTSAAHDLVMIYKVTTDTGVITVIEDMRGCPLAE